MGRHRRGWLSGLVTAVKRYYGFPDQRFPASGHRWLRMATAEEAVPSRFSASLRRSSDDWLADPPTVEFPVVRPRRTGAKEALTARIDRYWNETPLFMAVVETLGMNELIGAVA